MSIRNKNPPVSSLAAHSSGGCGSVLFFIHFDTRKVTYGVIKWLEKENKNDGKTGENLYTIRGQRIRLTIRKSGR